VEYRAAEERMDDAGAIRLQKIGEERPAAVAHRAERGSEHECDQQDAERVIPVEELEAPLRWRKLAGVRPRAPAEHGDHAEDDSQRVTVNDEHCGLPRLCW